MDAIPRSAAARPPRAVMTAVGFVTDFADQAVILPLAVGTAVVLALAGWWRGAIVWSLAVGGTLAAMAVLKLASSACGHLLPISGLHSPSGHTAAAGAVYGGLLAIGAERVSGHARWTLACALSLAVVIGLSRLALGVHTVTEVVVGGMVGLCGALVLAWQGGLPPPGLRLAPMAILALAVMAAFHGLHLPVESELRAGAGHIWPFSLCHR